MKKTINVSLGRASHTLEEDAFERLQSYLNKLKNHFAGLKDSEEIMADIESRFSEQLAGAGAVVTLEEVEKVIASMGEPEETGGREEAKQESAGTRDTRQLFRDPDDCIVAGAASGLSAYFGIDPIWLRLFFGVSLVVGGFGE